jgi:hypothetical protein
MPSLLGEKRMSRVQPVSVAIDPGGPAGGRSACGLRLGPAEPKTNDLSRFSGCLGEN